MIHFIHVEENMSNLHALKPIEFNQPTTHSYSRTMQGLEEVIQYLPNSHVKIWYNTEPASYDEHFHKCIEIIFMLEGDSEALFDSSKFALTTGDILIVPPYIMHGTKASHPYKEFVLQLDISPLSIFGIYSSSNSTINDILLCNKEKCPQIYDTIYNNLIDMINSYFTYEPYWELETYSHFLQMITCVGKYYDTSANATIKSSGNVQKQHSDKFAEILLYIDTNYAEQLTLDGVASLIGFSKYHFIRLFKEYTGTTFYEYLTAKRIQHAKELLFTNMEITEIAFSCGFNNQTSFCRTFKKECKMPPTEYRQRLLNSATDSK